MSDLARLSASIERTNDSLLLSQLQKYVTPAANPGNQFALASLLLGKRSLEARVRGLASSQLADLLAGKSSAILESAWLADEGSALDAAVALATDLISKNASSSTEPPALAIEASPFDAVRCLTEICYFTSRYWAKTSGRGLRAADARLLTQRLQLPEQVIQVCFELLQTQGLVISDGQSWVPSQRGESWMATDYAERWLQITRHFLESTTLAGAKELLTPGLDLASFLRTEYPLLRPGEDSLIRSSAALGLLSEGRVSPLLLLFLSAEPDSPRLVAEIAQLMPSKPPGVIVQSNLSILVTGPMTAKLWRDLDEVAESIELGVASTFRLSLASVTNALQKGWTPSSIAEFFAEQSGREIPQPLGFLLRDAERRFGQLDVLVEPRGCSVRSRDAILIAQIQNEPGLAGLRLRLTDAETLESTLSWREVGLALRASGYPALMHPAPAPEAPQSKSYSTGWAGEWLQAIRSATGSGENTREQLLQFALRDGIPLSITFRGPSGVTTVSVRVLGVTPQRIRCREIGREAELTLPQSSISEITIGTD